MLFYISVTLSAKWMWQLAYSQSECSTDPCPPVQLTAGGSGQLKWGGKIGWWLVRGIIEEAGGGILYINRCRLYPYRAGYDRIGWFQLFSPCSEEISKLEEVFNFLLGRRGPEGRGGSGKHTWLLIFRQAVLLNSCLRDYSFSSQFPFPKMYQSIDVWR